jgi:hypothetical protein
VFTSRPISLLASIIVYMFFCIVSILSPNQLPDKHAVIMNKYNQSYNMICNMDYYLFNKTRQDHHNKNKLIIIHQNIRGIKNKVEEFLISLTDIAPQIICLSNHRLRLDEIDNVNFNQYMIGNSFCRQIDSYGGVCVLIKKTFNLILLILINSIKKRISKLVL